MKNIENMNALDDMAMAEVAGAGDFDRTIVDDFVDWLSAPVGEFVDALADAIDSDDRPLPFPVVLGGKTPIEAPRKSPYVVLGPTDTSPVDLPFI